MLERMKKLIELEDVDILADEICEQYLDIATKLACRYCNQESMPEDYNNTIVELAIYLYTHKESLDLKSMQEGERTASSNVVDGIPDYIKLALPLPRVRVM